MYNFNYDIKINEENGRPYIHLDEDYSLEPEHRFMAMELVAYSLNDLIMRYSNPERQLSKAYMDELIVAAGMVAELGDQLAVIVKEQGDSLDELKDILNKKDEDDNKDKDGKDSI